MGSSCYKYGYVGHMQLLIIYVGCYQLDYDGIVDQKLIQCLNYR